MDETSGEFIDELGVTREELVILSQEGAGRAHAQYIASARTTEAIELLPLNTQATCINEYDGEIEKQCDALSVYDSLSTTIDLLKDGDASIDDSRIPRRALGILLVEKANRLPDKSSSEFSRYINAATLLIESEVIKEDVEV